ncbi:MAG: amino acid ABC transporter ATP-binding protein [Clostridia bacterium]|nr:amino acid ABC transporter ATP-binding protein [Clostridia bacterium]
MYYVRDIHKTFGGNHVLKGVSLDIEAHKTTVLIGPSGSGKTTLLRCINLLELPDSGTVHLNGAELNFGGGKAPKYAGGEARALRMKTGMVFQNFQLFPHKTVLGNIIEGPVSVLKRDRDQAVAEAEALLQKVGLADKRDAWPRDLSGGQQQRVAIARALAMKPELLLFDEPTSALDPELEYEVLSIIRRLCEEKQTIVIITHKISFAQEVADKLVFFDEGRILRQGPWDEVNDGSVPRIAQFLNMLR